GAHVLHLCSPLIAVAGALAVAETAAAIPAQCACLFAAGDAVDAGFVAVGATAQHPWSVRASAHAGADDTAVITSNSAMAYTRRIGKRVYRSHMVSENLEIALRETGNGKPRTGSNRPASRCDDGGRLRGAGEIT